MKLIITLLIFIQSIHSFSQSTSQNRNEREIETLEKLKIMIDKDKAEELKAKETIYSFHQDVNAEIRNNSNKLSEEQLSSINSLNSILWNQIQERSKLYTSSNRFLSSEYNLISNYKQKVLNKLSSYLNDNEISPKKSNQNSSDNSANFKNENEELRSQVNTLKKQNEELMSSLNKMIQMNESATQNVEKALEELKKKDLQISELKKILSEK